MSAITTGEFFFAAGRILTAPIPPQHRGETKTRPCVVLNLNSEDEDFDPNLVIVVACSTSFSRRHPPVIHSHEVLIPADGQTLLEKPTVAVCDWVDEIRLSEIASRLGEVDPETLEEIIDKVLSCYSD